MQQGGNRNRGNRGGGSGGGGAGGRGGNNRFFLMKSLNFDNIQQSVQTGLWATQKHNEEKLAQAFLAAKQVILVFSVNMSGHFQGYAMMKSAPGIAANKQWSGHAAVGNAFQVEWKVVQDLPFKDTEHLRNPLNEDKPVRIGRDGQEIPANVGHQLLSLFNELSQKQGNKLDGMRRQPAPANGPPLGAGGLMAGPIIPGPMGPLPLINPMNPMLMGGGMAGPLGGALGNPLAPMPLPGVMPGLNPMTGLNPMAAGMMGLGAGMLDGNMALGGMTGPGLMMGLNGPGDALGDAGNALAGLGSGNAGMGPAGGISAPRPPAMRPPPARPPAGMNTMAMGNAAMANMAMSNAAMANMGNAGMRNMAMGNAAMGPMGNAGMGDMAMGNAGMGNMAMGNMGMAGMGMNNMVGNLDDDEDGVGNMAMMSVMQNGGMAAKGGMGVDTMPNLMGGSNLAGRQGQMMGANRNGAGRQRRDDWADGGRGRGYDDNDDAEYDEGWNGAARSRGGRRRDRSRSRSPPRKRDGPRANVLDMTYEEYLEMEKQVRLYREQELRKREARDLQKGARADRRGSGAPPQRNMGGSSSMGMGSAGGQQMGMMTEEQYVEHCKATALQNGTMFNEVVVRQYYAQMKMQYEAMVAAQANHM